MSSFSALRASRTTALPWDKISESYAIKWILDLSSPSTAQDSVTTQHTFARPLSATLATIAPPITPDFPYNNTFDMLPGDPSIIANICCTNSWDLPSTYWSSASPSTSIMPFVPDPASRAVAEARIFIDATHLISHLNNMLIYYQLGHDLLDRLI
jgi:hypothetical protein